MFSSIAFVVFAAGFISDASGLVRERRSAYEVALKCTKAGWNADVSELQKLGSEGPPDMAKLLEDACIYIRVRIDTDKPTASSIK